jgi:hypothetical protein
MPAPTITSVAPKSGPLVGGTAVTITGTNFMAPDVTTVTFGGVAATSLVVVSATSLTCTTPAGAAGAADVVATASSGAGTLTAGFTYEPVPTVTGVTPNHGPTAGGTNVVISGTGFTSSAALTTVHFGGVLATGVTVVNATTIEAIAPAVAAGPVPITVTTPGGIGTLTAGFTYETGTAPTHPPGYMCGRWPWRDGDTYPSISTQRTTKPYEGWLRPSPPATE